MDIDAPAIDQIDVIDEADIRDWAAQYLPPQVAGLFAGWLHPTLGDWVEDNASISPRDILVGAHQEWTGHGYPTPH